MALVLDGLLDEDVGELFSKGLVELVLLSQLELVKWVHVIL
jgi:hypothetical protein